MQGPLGLAAKWMAMNSGTCDKKLTRILVLRGITLPANGDMVISTYTNASLVLLKH
jgi:hypothetical protein